MNSISQSAGMPASKRQDSVVMGNQSYISVILRLIGAELYKIRRRTMSKVLSIVALVIVIVVFCIISIGSFFVLASPAATFLPACPTNTSPGVSCTNQSPTQAELNQVKQNALINVSSPLRLPSSLNIATEVMSTVGLVLILILTGTIVGGEYGVGTIRLMFTRGPTRTQRHTDRRGTSSDPRLSGRSHRGR